MNNTQQLDLIPIKTGEVDNLEMGVLPDGTTYLSGRSLAAACGVGAAAISTLETEWSRGSTKPRDVAIAKLLEACGYTEETLFRRVKHKSNTINAYPETVCMAILEYYAFDAPNKSTTAQNNYRALTKFGLRAYIYASLGYDPLQQQSISWRNFHDRLLLNDIPKGYYSIFSESAILVVPAIRNGLVVDEHAVPDISVGSAWSKHWVKQSFDQQFGSRIKYPHTYPDYYPQSAANHSLEAWVYPLSSVAEFRMWLQDVYLPNHFPKYLDKKHRDGAISLPQKEKILLLSK